MDCRTPATNRPSNRRSKLLLFDVDGTLLKSHGGALRAMTRAARRLFGPTFSLDEVDRNGRLDPNIIAAALKLHGLEATPKQLDAFRTNYIEELRTELRLFWLLPGAIELLEQLRAVEDVVLGLVTGNYAEVARIKLLAVGIDPAWFVANGFGDQAATRSELVRRAIQSAASLVERSIQRRDVIIIGDTPRDVDCAKANGCACVAVATGNYGVEVLAATEADVVLRDLTTPAPLWAMLDNPD